MREVIFIQLQKGGFKILSKLTGRGCKIGQGDILMVDFLSFGPIPERGQHFFYLAMNYLMRRRAQLH